MRPFWPGGDYQAFDYPDGCVVVDNPPFSILSKICTFYLAKGIDFFLFAPSLTCFSGRDTIMRINHIICNCNIIYENGANVRTSFVSSFGGDIVAQTAPDLTRLVNETSDRLRRERVKELPKYAYPNHVVTAALMQRYAKYGVEWEIHRDDCTPVYVLDAQRPEKKSIFGGGLLLSDAEAAKHAEAEKLSIERAAEVQHEQAARAWPLSDREKDIIKTLG